MGWVQRKLEERRLRRRFEAVGPWASKFWINGVSYGGEIDYSNDERVPLFSASFPDARSVLELGSLEGAHTFQLARLPKTQILAIEGRPDNIKRAKIVQDTLGLKNVTFRLSNIETISLADSGKFDAVFCSGVFYHLPEPWNLVREIAKVSDCLFLATHYVTEEHYGVVSINGYKGIHCDEGTDILSGLSSKSVWLTLDSIRHLLITNDLKHIEVLRTFVQRPGIVDIGGEKRGVGGEPQVWLTAHK